MPISTSQDHLVADVKVESGMTETFKPSEPPQQTRDENDTSSKAEDKADLSENLMKPCGDLEIKTSHQPALNPTMEVQATSKSSSDAPQIADSSTLLVPDIKDQPRKEQQIPEDTERSQDQEAKTETPDCEIKMIDDDDAASVTSSESSTMPELVPVTIASSEQKQQPLDVEVKVITEAPRPSEVTTMMTPMMPGIKEESRDQLCKNRSSQKTGSE